ncbi:MAG: class I tRNA ligase family protein, partial [Actinobacteria bacterium]|nr:class I tRNA ligase family protein [Actinomycetota bacterium]NIU22703.1 class I tRNA ligase family protein [Actinomycetota bacterium]NIX54064.1 class I tRNA ligase family protein [Actinomycetota bacterium]
MEGTFRFLDRVWRMGHDEMGTPTDRGETDADREILAVAHRTLKKVTEDIDRFAFNTAVAALMEFANALQAYLRDGGRTATFREAYR